MYVVYGSASRLYVGGGKAPDDVAFDEAVDVPAYRNAMAAWVKYGSGGLNVPRFPDARGFEALFDGIAAAGGLVLSSDETRALVIVRHGKFDLPKGKAEDGETLEQTALREVEEETGAQALRILRPLLTTRHVYRNPFRNGRWTLKTTHWFLMKTNGVFAARPQTDEGVTRAEFLPLSELLYLETYPAVADVFRAYCRT